jgi:hypothetical protein
MADNTSPFNTQSKEDSEKLAEAILAIFPPFFQQFEPILARTLGQALGLNSQAIGPNGRPLYGGASFGSTSLLGPQDHGLNATIGANNIILDALVDKTVTQAEKDRSAQLRKWHEQFAKKDGQSLKEGEIDKLMDTGITPAGFLHGMAWNQRDPNMLYKGIRESAQYMGVGIAPSSDTQQFQLRKQFSEIGNRITESWNDTSQSAEWGGMGGRDLGQVMTELGRTGAFRKNIGKANEQVEALGPNASEGDITSITDKLTQETTKTAQEAAQAVQAFRQIFTGTVPQVIKSMNALLGTDVLQTFQDGGQDLINNMAATALATGHTVQNMSALAYDSGQFSESRGFSRAGSVAAGTLAAQVLAAGKLPGAPDNFNVNEGTLRQAITRTVTAAKDSTLVKDLSGAYAMVKSLPGGDAKAEKFLDLMDTNELRTGSDVAKLLQQEFPEFKTATPFDLRSASWSRAATEARDGGLFNREGVESWRLYQRDIRKNIVGNELKAKKYGFSAEDQKDIREQLSGTDFTETDISKALDQTNLVSWRKLGLTAAVSKRFAEGNPDLNPFENEKMYASLSGQGLDSVQKRVDGIGSFQKLVGQKGPGGALANLNAYIHKMKTDGPGFAGAEQIYTAMTGDTDITGKELTDFVQVAEKLSTAVTEGENEDELRGLGLAVQSLFTHTTWDGKLLSAEEVERRQAIVSAPLSKDPKVAVKQLEKRRGELAELSEKAYEYDPDKEKDAEGGGVDEVIRILGLIYDWTKGIKTGD